PFPPRSRTKSLMRTSAACTAGSRLWRKGPTGPTTPAADSALDDRGVLVVPDILANAGGVTCSYFEQVQGAINEYWRRSQVFDKLDLSLVSAFRAVQVERHSRQTDQMKRS